MSKEIRVYRQETLDAIKAIDNVREAMGTSDVLESMGELAAFKVGEQHHLVDKQVRAIWKGFAYGKWRELRSEGLQGLVHKKLKT